jgi:hypothetical protein
LIGWGDGTPFFLLGSGTSFTERPNQIRNYTRNAEDRQYLVLEDFSLSNQQASGGQGECAKMHVLRVQPVPIPQPSPLMVTIRP